MRDVLSVLEIPERVDRMTIHVSLVSDARLIARVLFVLEGKGKKLFIYQCPLLSVRLTVVGRFSLGSDLIGVSTGRVVPRQLSQSPLRKPLWSNRVTRAGWSRFPAGRISCKDAFQPTYRERPFRVGLGSAVGVATPARGQQHHFRFSVTISFQSKFIWLNKI